MTHERRPEIMIVDDVPGNLQFLERLLSDAGYRVRPAPSGRAALASARLAPPDLLLLDVSMPGMDGYEVCAEFKRDAGLSSIPVIFVSALGETIDKSRAFSVGGVDYIAKPFYFEELEARVRTHVHLSRLARAVEEEKRRLQESYEKLQQVETMRDDLSHMIIHDLRTPLAVIRGYLQLILHFAGPTPDARLVESATRAGAACTRMIDLVGSILDLHKLEAGELSVATERCDLAEIARRVIGDLGVLATGQVSLETPGDPVHVAADPELLRRVLQNLVANAMQHVSPRTGRVRVSVEPGAAEFVRVVVEDNGPGIPPEHRERVFDKFAQLDDALRRSRTSTGLGLAFCKMAILAHGGQIGVDSAVGEGSRFWFLVPAFREG